MLVSPIIVSLERHIDWSAMCVCRSGCGIVAKRLSGCHWDVGRGEGVMIAEEESGEFMEKS